MTRALADAVTRLIAMRAADVLDLILVAALIYGLLYAVRGTRAVQLLRGVLLLALAVFVFSSMMELVAFTAVFEYLLPAAIVAVPVVFQPELRRALERLGRAGTLLARPGDGTAGDVLVPIVAEAARSLSDVQHGALIVIERSAPLSDLIEQSVRLDAALSSEMLRQIFVPNSPLHDGAVIIAGGRIAGARAVIPLSDDDRLSGESALGTRHLAASAITGTSDALAVVVSEETGTISLARDGRLTRHLDEVSLAELVASALTERAPSAEHVVDTVSSRLLGLVNARSRRSDGAAPDHEIAS